MYLCPWCASLLPRLLVGCSFFTVMMTDDPSLSRRWSRLTRFFSFHSTFCLYRKGKNSGSGSRSRNNTNANDSTKKKQRVNWMVKVVAATNEYVHNARARTHINSISVNRHAYHTNNLITSVHGGNFSVCFRCQIFAAPPRLSINLSIAAYVPCLLLHIRLFGHWL